MHRFQHWRWHLDEMYVKLNGEMVYLWQAVDHEGTVLESYVTRTRGKKPNLTGTRYHSRWIEDSGFAPEQLQQARRFLDANA